MESFTVAGSNIGVGRTDVSNSGAPKAVPTYVVASAANRASSVPYNKYCTLPMAATSSSESATVKPEPLALSVARSTFYGIRRSTYGRSTSPVYTTARSKFYAMNGGGGTTSPNGDDGVPKLTVVQPLANGEPVSAVPAYANGYPKNYRSVETRYGVTAVTNPHGVTHYFIPSTSSASSSSSDSASGATTLQQDCKAIDNPIYPLPSVGGKLSKGDLATRL